MTVSLKSKFLYQLSVSLLFSIAPVITFPYVSRVLGPENIGRINFIDYACQFLILLASFGIPYYGVREIAKAGKDIKRISLLISELTFIHVLITLFSITIFSVLIFFQPAQSSDKELIALAAINILANAFGLEWMIHGLEDFKFLARRSFLVKIISLAAIFILIRSSSDYLNYYLILIAGNVAILIIDLLYVLKKKIGFIRPQNIRKHLKPLSLFFLTTVSLSLYTFFDTVILGIISGTLAVGFYTTGLKILRLSQNLINDIGSVMLPRVSFLIEKGEKSEINRIINKSLQYIITIAIPFGTFIFLASHEIISLLAGEKFLASVAILQLLSVLPLIAGLTNLFFLQVLLPHGKEKIILAGLILGSLVSIASNIILCPIYGERGAALSCIAAEISIALFLGLYSVKQVRFQMPWQTIGGSISAALSFVPVIFLCQKLSGNPLIVLITEGIFCLASFVLIQLLFRNNILREGIQFFFPQLKAKQAKASEFEA